MDSNLAQAAPSSEVFALTDEQIVGIGDDATEQAATHEVPVRQTKEAAQTSRPESANPEGTTVSGAPHSEAPQWLAEHMGDPQHGEAAKQFWDDQQRSAQENAAFRESFATPADARALKELYPGGIEEAKSAAERARAMDEIDAAFYRGDSATRAQLAQRMMQQDPAAFREMVEAGVKLLNANQETAHNAEARSHFANQEIHSAKPAEWGRGGVPGRPTQTEAAPEVVRAYREFESAANADLEKSVGTAIARVMEQALPNLKLAASTQDGQQAAPLRDRLTTAVREEVDAALRSDRQLGEQVARVLSGRRFDEAARTQVVRLIDARAQQLVPSAVKRVVSSWTAATLGTQAKHERALVAGTNVGHDERATQGGNNTRGRTETRPVVLSARRVDYRRMSDEDILGL
jgi:hypothetical protein